MIISPCSRSVTSAPDERCCFHDCRGVAVVRRAVRVRPGEHATLSACSRPLHGAALACLAERCGVGRPSGVMRSFTPRVRDWIVAMFELPELREPKTARLRTPTTQVVYRGRWRS